MQSIPLPMEPPQLQNEKGKWIRADRIENTSTHQAITATLDRYREQIGKPGTTYEYAARRFLRHTAKAPAAINLNDCAAYIEYTYRERTKNESTIENTLTTLRHFLRFLGHDDWASALGRNDGTGGPTRRQPRNEPPTATETAILNECADYLDWLRSRRRTKATLDNIRSHLRFAVRILGTHPRDWDRNAEISLLDAWHAIPLEPSSINSRAKALRRVVAFYRGDNDRTLPFWKWNGERENEPNRQWPRPTDFARIITLANSNGYILWQTLALRLLTFTAMRLHTITQLRWDHVDFDSGYINTKSKMGKTIHVPINDGYLLPILRAASDASTSPYVLDDTTGHPIGDKRLQHLAGTVSRIATGTEYSPHDYRRGAAQWFYETSGKDLIATRDFLTHDNVATTSKYLGLDLEDRADTFRTVYAKMILPTVPPTLAKA